MRRRTVQPKNRSFVSVLRSSATLFDRTNTIAKIANFTKNAKCFEECNVFGNRKCELKKKQRGEKDMQIFGKEKCKTLRQFQCLNKKKCKLLRQFRSSVTKVTSLPSISMYLSLSLSLSLSLLQIRSPIPTSHSKH